MVRFKIALISLLLISLSHALFSQHCEIDRVNFKGGERVSFRAFYNWGLIWVNAGDVEFSVSDTTYLDKPTLHLKAVGWSLKQYDWFFKVRDRFESIVHPTTIQPYWFERDTHEGRYKAYNRYVFNRADSVLDIISHTSDRPFKREFLPLPDCTFDVLSAIYYCRNIDFNRYAVGDKIPLTMGVDDEIFNLHIRYMGKERLTTRSGEVYNTIRFKVMLVEGTIFKGGEDLEVWVTDDKNRVPVLVDAKILVGSVKAVLTGAEGLLYPMEALVEEAQ